MLGVDWFGKKRSSFLRERLHVLHEENKELQKRNAKLLKMYDEVQEKIEKIKIASELELNTLYLNKYSYTEKDITHGRKAYAPGTPEAGGGLRTLAFIDDEWTIFVSDVKNKESGKILVPGQYLEYKKLLNVGKVTKKHLLDYLIDRRYVLEDTKND